MWEHDATEVAYKNGYEKGKADAAKEIFAEIEDYMLGIQVNGFPALVINPDAFAELKKKYTEGGV